MMAVNDIPSICTDLTKNFGFELSINILHLIENNINYENTEVDEKFVEMTGFMLLNLAEELYSLNPNNNSRKIFFDVALEEEISVFGFNLYNQNTIH